MERGRKPRGSRAAKTRSGVIMTSENAPSMRRSASANGLDERHLSRLRDEVDDDLGVAGGLEDAALRSELVADDLGVVEIAVVGEGDACPCCSPREWAGRLGALSPRWWSNGCVRWRCCRGAR